MTVTVTVTGYAFPKAVPGVPEAVPEGLESVAGDAGEPLLRAVVSWMTCTSGLLWPRVPVRDSLEINTPSPLSEAWKRTERGDVVSSSLSCKHSK